MSEKAKFDLLVVLYFKLESDAIFIGYHFHGNARGKGFAREAVAGLISFLKARFEKPIKAKVDSQNERSIHLLMQLGFQRMENYAIRQFFKEAEQMEWCFTQL